MSTDDAMLDELLGAYALDGVDADEAVAVEEYLARAPHVAHEVARLRNAAAWIGATEALTPPPCISTRRLTSVSPIPRPPWARSSERSTWVNSSNTLASMAGGMPTPLSRNGHPMYP